MTHLCQKLWIHKSNIVEHPNFGTSHIVSFAERLCIFESQQSRTVSIWDLETIEKVSFVQRSFIGGSTVCNYIIIMWLLLTLVSGARLKALANDLSAIGICVTSPLRTYRGGEEEG